MWVKLHHSHIHSRILHSECKLSWACTFGRWRAPRCDQIRIRSGGACRSHFVHRTPSRHLFSEWRAPRAFYFEENRFTCTLQSFKCCRSEWQAAHVAWLILHRCCWKTGSDAESAKKTQQAPIFWQHVATSVFQVNWFDPLVDNCSEQTVGLLLRKDLVQRPVTKTNSDARCWFSLCVFWCGNSSCWV